MSYAEKNPTSNGRTPRWFLLLLVSYPLIIIFDRFSLQHGFLNLPRFGEFFIDKAIPELKALNPPIQKRDGYDGQFYAQMAIDPLLRSPAMADGFDDVGYRGQRIGLSAIAYVLGGGQPAIVVQVYSVLNFVFWCLMCWLVLKWVGTETIQQRCVVLVIVYTAGALVSIARALTDLPAAVLGLLAVWFTQHKPTERLCQLSSLVSFCLSTLCKETGVLSALAIMNLKNWKSFLKSGLFVVLALIPVFMWTIYVKTYIGSGSKGMGAITIPLMGIAAKFQIAFARAYNEFPSVHPIEIIGPASILVQAVYVLRRLDWRSEYWRFGAGFAVLPFFVAFAVWETQTAFSRVLLPLTLAFNLHLFSIREKLKSKKFNWWFWLGNAGLLDRAFPMLVVWTAIEYGLHRKRRMRTTQVSAT